MYSIWIPNTAVHTIISLLSVFKVNPTQMRILKTVTVDLELNPGSVFKLNIFSSKEAGLPDPSFLATSGTVF